MNIIGQQEAMVQARAYMGGQAMTAAALFIGPQGIGKTMTALAIASEYNLDPVTISAKTSDDISADISRATGSTLDGLKKLMIVEDIEGVPPAILQQFLDIRMPKIFIAHKLEDVHWRIHSLCQHVVFKPPSLDDFLEYFRQMEKEPPPTVTLTKFRNFFDAQNWLRGGNRISEPVRTELEQAREIFNEGASEGEIKFPRLMEFYIYNGGNPQLGRELDLMYHDGMEKEAQGILLQQTLTMRVNVPFRYRYKGTKRFGVYIRVLGFDD